MTSHLDILLKEQSTVHEGIKKFKCDYETCEKVFGYKSHLNQHKIQHLEYDKRIPKENLRLFKCELCPKSYNYTCHLKRHILSIHEGVRFTCHICDKKIHIRTTFKEPCFKCA